MRDIGHGPSDDATRPSGTDRAASPTSWHARQPGIPQQSGPPGRRRCDTSCSAPIRRDAVNLAAVSKQPKWRASSTVQVWGAAAFRFCGTSASVESYLGERRAAAR